MSRRGWWKLVVEEVDGKGPYELDDCDREHISELIEKGFTSGELSQDPAEEEVS